MLAGFAIQPAEHLASDILDTIPPYARNQFALKFPVVTPKRTKHADEHFMIIA